MNNYFRNVIPLSFNISLILAIALDLSISIFSDFCYSIILMDILHYVLVLYTTIFLYYCTNIYFLIKTWVNLGFCYVKTPKLENMMDF